MVMYYVKYNYTESCNGKTQSASKNFVRGIRSQAQSILEEFRIRDFLMV